MMQGLVIVGGLTFSLAASLLIEELIFGRIVRLAFARRPKPVLSSQLSVLSSWTAANSKSRSNKGPDGAGEG